MTAELNIAGLLERESVEKGDVQFIFDPRLFHSEDFDYDIVPFSVPIKTPLTDVKIADYLVILNRHTGQTYPVTEADVHELL